LDERLMILIGGILSETPIAMVVRELQELGAKYALFNQRSVADCAISWRLDDGGLSGALTLPDQTLTLEDVSATYLRLMDDRLLPEVEELAVDDPLRKRARAFHDAMMQWAEVAPARVVNRAAPQGSNGSKPYQAQLIAQSGLLVPPTLITSDPDAVLAFRSEHGAIIYKSISGVRSIVRALGEEDLARLEHIRWCPVQFQALVPGTDIRVHVIGDDAIATEIVSDRVDYRYARREGGNVELRPTTLPDEIASRCIRLTATLGLSFSGIDLKATPDGDWYCFEVNPSPAFSYFEANAGQPIAATLARFLAEAE
jgi:glutathione synthase/RimK-type ligase-like ATP-grasp enzyme